MSPIGFFIKREASILPWWRIRDEVALRAVLQDADSEIGAPSDGAPGEGASGGCLFHPLMQHRGMSEQKVWHSRGYLPHCDQPGLIQGITFRLYDSMPGTVLEQWTEELECLPQSQRDIERQRRIAAYLDAGHGACWLRDGRIAEVVENTLLHFDGDRYRLLAWVVMPNHVHVLAEMREAWPLAKVVYSWKTWTAKRANEILDRSGTFWFREYHDRFIRDATHLANARSYIEENPVKAGLSAAKEDWPWGSARLAR